MGHEMPVFTPSHLGKWEDLFHTLLEGDSLPLTTEGIWFLGSKPGIVAVLHEGEPIFIEASKDIAKTVSDYVNGAARSEFRVEVAVMELGASPRTAPERVKDGPLADRLNKVIASYRFNVVPATAAQVEKLAEAFTVVADPRLNGPTAKANTVIDALPR